MGTATISASVSSTTKAIANARIREVGQTPNGLIKSLWEHIASTGDVPIFEENDSSETKRRNTIERMHQLMDEMPKGTPLSTMTVDDIRKELADRDC